jgi:ABC-type multidrug transport system fused ATPase/permease subunit
MGYVPQQPYILDASLAENVAFGIPKPEIDESRIIEILKALDLTELVQQLPDGISTNIGERGGRLSGGQLQRLAIARALYFDAAILLLDEPTNQLDRQNELEILKVLNQLSFQGKTIIMVTHKPNVEFFTTMYQLEDGQLNVVAMAENHGLP